MTTEPLIFEMSRPGRMGVSLPVCDVPETELPSEMLRGDLPLPEVNELEVVRHYTRLSQLNYGVDVGFYPLGSCTMKGNPKVNEVAARLPAFTDTHPYQAECQVQGNLRLMYELQEWLKEIGGFAGVSLQPAAGAHGEFAGILMIRAYHRARGDPKRVKILIPDSAHGTNPASVSMSGFEAVEIPSDERGNADLEMWRAQCDDTVAGIMLTNPNTLGLFDENVEEIVRLVRDCGGLVYGDGANMNALMGIVKPGDLGFDVLHYNLHKTFSAPHGGGGPGSGPVGVSERLLPYLPGPIVVRGDDDCDCDLGKPCYHLKRADNSIGRLKAFYGNFGVMVRAYTYIRMHGAAGLRKVSEDAVLAANYLKARLEEVYPPAYDRVCMHEYVTSGRLPGVATYKGITMDIAKRLMDYGFHPPTVYFPLIVPEALMIEPTETESVETLDAFADALLEIAREAREEPELLHSAPRTTPVKRLDETKAGRELNLCWRG